MQRGCNAPDENGNALVVTKTDLLIYHQNTYRMVYLVNFNGAQSVLIPKPVTGKAGSYAMTLRSTVNLSVAVDATVIDLAVSRIYYYVAVTLPEWTQPGEYEYTLFGDGEPLASGLAVIRDAAPVVQYEKPIQYEQYEAN